MAASRRILLVKKAQGGVTIPIHYCEDFGEYVYGGTFYALTINPCIITATVNNTWECWVCKDYGAGYFTDFLHAVDFGFTAASVGADYSRYIFWMLSNEVDGWVDLKTANKTAICLMWSLPVLNTYRFTVMEIYNGIEYSNSCDVPYQYPYWFITIEKTGSTITCKIYAEEERTTLLGTVSLTLHGDWSFRYLHATQSYYTGWSHTTGGRVTRLDLDYTGVVCTCPG